jgi:hypothetical protein
VEREHAAIDFAKVGSWKFKVRNKSLELGGNAEVRGGPWNGDQRAIDAL